MTTKELVPPGAHQRGQGTFQQQLEIRMDGITEAPPECAICGQLQDLYSVGGSWLCIDHIAECVGMAATDLWPDLIVYKKAFQDVLI